MKKTYSNIISVIISIFLPILSHAQNISSEIKYKLKNLYNHSQVCLREGNYDKAIELKKEIFNTSKELDSIYIKSFGAISAFDLSDIYYTIKNDQNQYIYWLNEADLCKHPLAAGLLGDAYLNLQRFEDFSQDLLKAKYYYEKSDEGRCKWILATMYSKNGEFGRNDKEFLKYANQALEKNYPDAQFVLGIYYLYGEIVNKNVDEGISLIKAAAQQNHIKAIRFIEENNIH